MKNHQSGAWKSTRELRTTSLHLLSVEECRRLSVHHHGSENESELKINAIRHKFYWWKFCQSIGLETGYTPETDALMRSLSL